VHEQVHGKRDDIHVSGPLTVSEKRSLNPVRTGKHAELRVAHAAAAVIVRMKRENDVVAVLQMLVHVFNLARVHMRHGKLNRARQIDDRLSVRGPGFQTSRTALQTSSANSGSVPVKLSGLYSKR
jgi:hypothetical protein